MHKKKILVADDEVNILKVIREELKSEGYEVDLAYDGEDANKKIRKNKYDVAILDIRMPKKDGIQVLKEMRSISPETIVIIMTAFGTIENAVEAIKIGAYDYLTKPFDSNELINKIQQALKIKEKRSYNVDTSEEKKVVLIGKSKEIERIKSKIEKIKDLQTTILLTGESGTGKGVVAQAIHFASNRNNLPFIHVNCAVLPENLIESELFGHEKGAFTGAFESKKGKFELAGKGTIFLDEINTLSPNLQAKLLTVLQEKRMEKIGGAKTILVEARIIAATNENLEEAVRRKEFREDLFYRLNVITIECAPLRHRRKDIEVLTLYFLNNINRKFNKNVMEISSEVWHILKNYDWPGNVRELENALESAVALANNTTLYEDDLPLRIIQKVERHKDLDTNDEMNVFKVQESKMIKKALEKHGGHREKTAKELGISRRTLQYKLKKFGLINK
ncbi:nitrogen fixation sigma-54 dependent transcriptional regulator GnfM [Clostridium sediminicola]|uniref:sigma-54-dependent transcriptional regulator n=1 Tax=Clostridium sediminicola TaxID=3114879 RepID=UPI0031F2158F